MSRPCCPLCGSEEASPLPAVRDYEYLTSDDCFTYCECAECECVFLRDPPVDRLQEIYPANYYSNSSNSDASSFFRFLESVKERLDARLFAKVLSGISASSISVLDVGGGAGWLSDVIRKSDPRVDKTTVVDLNEASRPEAEARGHGFVCDRIEQFRTQERFDLIVMLNLIEHVESPAKVLQSMRALLSENGRIIVKTPNTRTWDRRLFRDRYWGGLHCPRHWVLFDKDNFCATARDCGLEVQSFSYTQGAPQWVGSVLGSWNASRWELDGRGNLKTVPESTFLAPLSLFFAALDFLRVPFFPTAQMVFVLGRGT